MKTIALRAAAACAVAALAFQAQGYELLADTLRGSEIYPGTTHTYTVSLPEGYNPDGLNCLYVGLDGALYRAPEVIDSLIATGDMPPTVGVYFQPGVITDEEGRTVRYNRSNEYDAVDSRLASFIETELLPAARTLTDAMGRPVRFTDNPDCHAISGASSGGIGAFVVAWTRPDLFRRVYTTCGTYVAMRGGDQLAAVVRKTEPQPIRMVIHDGSRDAWNPLFGHWYEQNRLLASSLNFAGYDLMESWDDGNHSIRLGALLFPEAMKFLWRDYPAPVALGHSNNDFLPGLLVDGESWHPAKAPKAQHCGLSALYPTHEYRVEQLGDTQWLTASHRGADGTFGPRQKAYLLHDLTFEGPGIAGMAFDRDGNLYVATTTGLQVADQNGRVRAILPWPAAGRPERFWFVGNKIYVEIGGKVYSRRLASEAAPAGPIEVKSQGQA